MAAGHTGGAVVCLGLAVLAGPAEAYYARNNFVVEQISPVQMVVYPRSGLNPIDAWCAVGDYVITMLDMPVATKIWRISEPPRKRGEGIVFSLTDEGAASTSGLNTLGEHPLYVTAAAGRAFCPQSILFWSGL